MMSINAVKGVEIGSGFAAARLTGEQNADEMRLGPDGKPVFSSNHAGGILGGLSTGPDIVIRFAVQTTPSILSPRPTPGCLPHHTDIPTTVRHDTDAGLPAVSLAEHI